MKKWMFTAYVLLIAFLCLYSYVLVDPNITFVQNSAWVQFRSYVIQIGYFRRDISWFMYLGFVMLLYFFNRYFTVRYKETNVVHIVVLVGGILILSYPFLSHDFFNYMFDARIFTFYGKNPYLFKALDFPADQWTRFMHWTHRTYPYGPVFLVISFIPSLLGLGKFSLTFVLFKGMFVAFYAAAALFLAKMNKKWGIMFATHPLVIIEGLISSHNDMVGVGIAVIGLYFLFKGSKGWFGRVILLLSTGIKYTTLPALVLAKKGNNQHAGNLMKFVSGNWNKAVFAVQIAGLAYVSSRMGIQPWYFLTLFVYIPFFPNLITSIDILLFGLLVSYYPYIRLGGWDMTFKVDMKNQIIFAFTVLNLVFLLALRIRHWSHLQMELRKSER